MVTLFQILTLCRGHCFIWDWISTLQGPLLLCALFWISTLRFISDFDSAGAAASFCFVSDFDSALCFGFRLCRSRCLVFGHCFILDFDSDLCFGFPLCRIHCFVSDFYSAVQWPFQLFSHFDYAVLSDSLCQCCFLGSRKCEVSLPEKNC